MDPNDFYCITIYPSSIVLQGDYKSELVKGFIEKNFNSELVKDKGWIELTRSNIEITLT